jgi:hypothetical protein
LGHAEKQGTRRNVTPVVPLIALARWTEPSWHPMMGLVKGNGNFLD